MTRRFPETFLTLLGCLLLLAALASAVGAVPLEAAPPSGCAGRVCQVNGDWEIDTCFGSCSPTLPCKEQFNAQTENIYCGCTNVAEPACCHVYVNDGKAYVGGDCPNCSASGSCGFQLLENGCKIARCN